jgi:predicted DNA binding protein
MPAEDEGGVAIVQLEDGDLAGASRDIETAPPVTDFRRLTRGDTGVVVQLETERALLLVPLREAGVPVDTPFEIHNGRASWELTASRDRLSNLVDLLETVGVAPNVESIDRAVDAEQLLTETQRELLEAAVDAGYYDTPREISLTDLADRRPRVRAGAGRGVTPFPTPSLVSTELGASQVAP